MSPTWGNKSKVGEVIGHRPPVLDRKVGDVLYKGNAALWLYLGHHAKVQDADLAVRRPQLQSMLAVSRRSGNEPLQASGSPAGGETGLSWPSLLDGQRQQEGSPGCQDEGQNGGTCTAASSAYVHGLVALRVLAHKAAAELGLRQGWQQRGRTQTPAAG